MVSVATPAASVAENRRSFQRLLTDPLGLGRNLAYQSRPTRQSLVTPSRIEAVSVAPPNSGGKKTGRFDGGVGLTGQKMSGGDIITYRNPAPTSLFGRSARNQPTATSGSGGSFPGLDIPFPNGLLVKHNASRQAAFRMTPTAIPVSLAASSDAMPKDRLALARAVDLANNRLGIVVISKLPSDPARLFPLRSHSQE